MLRKYMEPFVEQGDNFNSPEIYSMDGFDEV